ncbi:hypothetical protein HR060_10445 [Catenovulum sp. SM1970]|uniref:hypothetical protein n=1 Tax=Marinifaba aquimaris TaxID=2741323 RepID=UPI0015723794|nr:hypothetical protein [Marinifaba aquimaris]NTS77283.1 hypothetical protein [Marinifaba aquimaris]
MDAIKTVALGFGTINLLKENLAEVIIDEGVEMDLAMVNQYHQALLTNLTPPFDIVINKLNAYTYTFEAQLELGTLAEIDRLAVITYNSIAKVSTENLAKFPRNKAWNVEFFSDRQDAIDWLIA